MSIKVKDIISVIDDHAPAGIQEGFDNAGLLCGDIDITINEMLLCLDLTEEVLDEAISRGIQFIVSHHPLIFRGIKNLRPVTPENRIILKAIKNDIVIYSAHTNLDKVVPGVSSALADKIGLLNQQVLVPDSDGLLKLVTFIPTDYIEKVSQALFEAGAGKIGNYDSCSFTHEGQGSFRAGEGAIPFTGKPGEVHYESEMRFETIVPKYLKSRILKALIDNHPYEEVAFDLIPLENMNPYQGLGIVGTLPSPLKQNEFLKLLQNNLNLKSFRYTTGMSGDIHKIALCGGSGSEFLNYAKGCGAQAYISADFKYHQFFEGGRDIMIADIGHYESEIYGLDIIKHIVTKKIPNFAVHLSKINTNPIKYL